MSNSKELYNWGLYPRAQVEEYSPRNLEEFLRLTQDGSSLIARGNGRCYGDSSIGNIVLSTLKLNRILDFDAQSGVIRCEAGVTLDEILDLVVPQGFFLPVTPGTKFITIGGALASDIHGKNHHVDGVFSDHVVSFSLIDQNGTLHEIFPGDSLFDQTAGGMGLTGMIYAVSFRLKKISSSYIRVTKYRAKNLKEIFALFEEHPDPTYSVAWIDCLASGNSMGRSILMLGEHATASEAGKKAPLVPHKPPKLTVPFFFPNWALNKWTVKAFNTVFYNNPKVRSGKQEIIHYDPYFYPLDAIHHWNRIYGKKGFTQYQFVLPKSVSYEGVSEVLSLMQASGQASFLAVLKLFGKSHEDRYLHFPQEGYTLAVDFQVNDKVFAMLDKFDEIVTSMGGKVYLTKDARMSPETFKSMYSQQLPTQSKFQSSQSRRLRIH